MNTCPPEKDPRVSFAFELAFPFFLSVINFLELMGFGSEFSLLGFLSELWLTNGKEIKYPPFLGLRLDLAPSWFSIGSVSPFPF